MSHSLTLITEIIICKAGLIQVNTFTLIFLAVVNKSYNLSDGICPSERNLVLGVILYLLNSLHILIFMTTSLAR